MLETNAVAASSGAATPSLGSVLQEEMGKEDFLNLLVAQLRNQDPLSPMESQKFAGELAQFSSLEQLINIDDKLGESVGSNLVLTQTINNTLAANLLGKEVVSEGNQIRLEDAEMADIHFQLAAAAEKVMIKIRDTAGEVVRTIQLEAQPSGEQKISWDGKSDNDEKAAAGVYHFEVEALDSEGDAVAARGLMNGVVQSLRYANGQAFLMIDGREVAFSDVKEIRAAEE